MPSTLGTVRQEVGWDQGEGLPGAQQGGETTEGNRQQREREGMRAARKEEGVAEKRDKLSTRQVPSQGSLCPLSH